MLPTTSCHPRIDAMLAEPVARSSKLGRYTNFMNRLDCVGVAVPAGFLPDGLPFGVTLAAPANADVPLLHQARRWQQALQGRTATLGATGRPLPAGEAAPPAVRSGQVRLAVCGAHL